MANEVPQKPSRLALWIAEHGTPNQLRVEYRPTGTDTADTWIILTVTDYGKKGSQIEIKPEELVRDCYGYDRGQDVCLKLDHAHCVDLTDGGRKRLAAWKEFQKQEAADIAEFDRLKQKFGKTDPR